MNSANVGSIFLLVMILSWSYFYSCLPLFGIMLFLSLFFLYLAWKVLISRRFIKSLPIVPNDSILGYLGGMISLGDTPYNVSLLRIVERYGPFTQFQFFNYIIVAIHDLDVSREILLNIYGKGVLHVRLLACFILL